jgi:hypothetical protein
MHVHIYMHFEMNQRFFEVLVRYLHSFLWPHCRRVDPHLGGFVWWHRGLVHEALRIVAERLIEGSPCRVLMYGSASAGFFAPARETPVAKARYPEVLEGGTIASPCSEDFFAYIIDFPRSGTLKIRGSAKTVKVGKPAENGHIHVVAVTT